MLFAGLPPFWLRWCVWDLRLGLTALEGNVSGGSNWFAAAVSPFVVILPQDIRAVHTALHGVTGNGISVRLAIHVQLS